jgi:hypothetical protein
MFPVGTAARLGVNVLTTVSVSKVVNDVIQNNVNVVTTADAIRVWAGKFVIGMVVTDLALNNVNEKMNGIAEKFRGKEVEIKVTDATP